MEDYVIVSRQERDCSCEIEFEIGKEFEIKKLKLHQKGSKQLGLYVTDLSGTYDGIFFEGEIEGEGREYGQIKVYMNGKEVYNNIRFCNRIMNNF